MVSDSMLMEESNSVEGQSNGGSGFTDKTLVCRDCGSEFVFTAGEQEFYAEKGFQNEPKSCKACRDARRNGERPRTLYPAVCADCGGEARVPFEPSDGRPVYCSTCYEKRKQAESNSFGGADLDDAEHFSEAPDGNSDNQADGMGLYV